MIKATPENYDDLENKLEEDIDELSKYTGEITERIDARKNFGDILTHRLSMIKQAKSSLDFVKMEFYKLEDLHSR